MSYKLSILEISVLSKLLDGDLPFLVQLRPQLELCIVEKREFTSYGFFTTLAVPGYIPTSPKLDIKFGDVVADIQGLNSSAGFVLYIKNGILDMLEGYSCDELWPENISNFNLKYMNGEKRDWITLKKKLCINTSA